MKIRTKKRIGLFAGIIAAWFLVHMAFISWEGLHRYNGNADVAVILGNPVMTDGSLTPWLKGRVDEAAELYKKGLVKKIYASGGPGEEPIPEGTAMKSYLIAQNIPDSDIVADNLGKNTYYTAKDFIHWNDSLHFSTVVVVTSWYHITRTRYIFRKLGFSNVYGSASKAYFWKDAYGAVREFFAFYKYLLLY